MIRWITVKSGAQFSKLPKISVSFFDCLVIIKLQFIICYLLLGRIAVLRT